MTLSPIQPIPNRCLTNKSPASKALAWFGSAWQRELIEKDAELKKLHDRLKVAISLVQESVKSFAGETPALPVPEASLKLSEARRGKLLAHFKTVAPAQLNQKRQRRFHWLEMAAV